jgi:hypothetical protein
MATKTSTADRLRAAADFLDAHPGLPVPVITSYSSGTVDIGWQLMNDDAVKDDQRPAVQQIIRAIGGKWSKQEGGDTLCLRQKRDGLGLCIFVTREQVCERVVTGEELVTVPAVDARPERTEVREIVEWRCEPVLAESVSA